MAARAIWKARIGMGSTELPVKLYSAARDRAIHFRLLDEKHQEPVRQKMVDPKTGKVVEKAEIRRALEMDDGTLVILTDEELEKLEPEESREIEITRFVKTGSVSPEWYDRPYWLGPDGDEAAYFSLVEALRERDREGIARWVMRGKEYVGVLRVHGDYLTLITIHYAGEVVTAGSLDPPGGRDLAAKEVAMAKQIIEAMVDEFDLASFRDEYRDRVMELIDAKAEGKVIRFPKASRRPAEKPLADVLAKSLEAVKNGRDTESDTRSTKKPAGKRGAKKAPAGRSEKTRSAGAGGRKGAANTSPAAKEAKKRRRSA